jgi:hypothetical protein
MATKKIRRTYHCFTDDVGQDAAESIRATSPEEAARKYAEIGSWGQEDTTAIVNVYVRLASPPGQDFEPEEVVLHPPEPKCSSRSGHKWTDEYVTGAGGGVLITDRCAHCGCRRQSDTWATNWATGQQGYHTIAYAAEED